MGRRRVDRPGGAVIAFAEWLALREPADAAARSAELADRLPVRPSLVVHDLGSGTGSMVRWLAPRLRARAAGPQHWVLHDRDADLLAAAAADLPPGVDAETRVGDLTRLAVADLAGASLVTASALLDMLTADEIDRVVAACAGVPTLLTLTVVGAVGLDPPDPLDAAVAAAFDAHQRRTAHGRTLAGPDAVDAAVTAFRNRGIAVDVRETPWELASGPLLEAWFTGWVGAAAEQDPDLSAQLSRYVAARREQLAAGRLLARVGHRDLLAPGRG
jgi:trans-aconitate methyltransferase